MIRKCRLEKGMRQVDLAERLGVNEMTIVNWEQGKTEPNKAFKYRLKLEVDLKI